MYGINISMVYEMLENMDGQGLTRITDTKGEVHEVLMTEEIVGQALALPTSQFSLRERRQHSTLADIFKDPKKTANTYAQMKDSVMADQVRVLHHMLKLPKQQRHTVPDLAFVHAVDDARAHRVGAKKNWRQYFHQEIIEATKQKTHQKYLECGEYLTRIAYYLVGEVGLPTAFHPLPGLTAAGTPQKGKKKAKQQDQSTSSSNTPSEYRVDTEDEVDIAATLQERVEKTVKAVDELLHGTSSTLATKSAKVILEEQEEDEEQEGLLAHRERRPREKDKKETG